MRSAKADAAMSRLNLLLSLTKRAPAPIAAAGAYEVVKVPTGSVWEVFSRGPRMTRRERLPAPN